MKIKTLDMRVACERGTTEFDIVKKALKKDRKYSENLLFRGFDGDNIPQLLKEGQEQSGESELDELFGISDGEQDSLDEEVLFAYTERELLEETSSKTNIFEYASRFFSPAIAVYDSKHLKRESKDVLYSYIFKKPDKKREALVAVYKLSYPHL
jgi:hypothetical protein